MDPNDSIFETIQQKRDGPIRCSRKPFIVSSCFGIPFDSFLNFAIYTKYYYSRKLSSRTAPWNHSILPPNSPSSASDWLQFLSYISNGTTLWEKSAFC
jgi:hypothetical protein